MQSLETFAQTFFDKKRASKRSRVYQQAILHSEMCVKFEFRKLIMWRTLSSREATNTLIQNNSSSSKAVIENCS